jgi:hypothetical protein
LAGDDFVRTGLLAGQPITMRALEPVTGYLATGALRPTEATWKDGVS